MKIRSGFVSNSSSSNFCILGVEIDAKTCNTIEGKYKELKDTRVEIVYEIGDISFRDKRKFVGISATAMGDDETPRQIKRELIDTLHTIGVDIQLKDVDWHEDGGYNG